MLRVCSDGIGKSAGCASILVACCIALVGGGSAAAADFEGADCCASIEEHIAELEATTARKGSRKAKLTVSGHVNEAVMFWDDGYEQNAYLVTNDASRTRLRLTGEAKINDDVSAGFRIEIGVRTVNSKRSDQNQRTASTGLDLRRAWWGINSKTFGTVQVGRTITALEEVTEANLAGTNRVGKYSDVEDSGLGMLLRTKTAPTPSGVAWRRLLKHSGNQPGEGDAQAAIRYITPVFAGFSASVAWGGDDLWDAALEYAGEFLGFMAQARIGYGQNTDDSDDGVSFQCVATNLAAAPSDADCAAAGGSISILHDPTGLYANFAAGWLKDNNVQYSAFFTGLTPADTSTFWALEAGIRAKWHDLGPTTIFGQHYELDGGANGRQAVGAADAINPLGFEAGPYASEVEMWGIGIAQDISDAATKLYVLYRHYEADVIIAGAGQIEESEPLEDLDIVMTGAIIRF